MIFTTRFAPSPTGPLHLGHAYSALLAHDLARASGGRFLLRIEDIDRARARPEWEAQIYEDLAWLGIDWPEPVMRQSGRLPVYHAVLQDLWERNAVFACHCTRRDIAEAANAPQEGATILGPDGIVYPGTCRGRRCGDGETAIPTQAALRLDMGAIAEGAAKAEPLGFHEAGCGPDGQSGWIGFTFEELCRDIGDVVLSRRDMGTSYHLSVVLDDAAQGITHVLRGQDLFEATKIHVVLQRLLGLPTPIYNHHKLIRDEAGRRLAKRDDARAISLYRSEGRTPQDIRKMVGL
ncbi:tRNA glutamyl-Q(34) synthetase GluQRS [Sulfitobacter aestuarii]|uniref:tRNA glutamyl-Q(34) synthetase GluQRS n=1 Tax=Sulfitobacter aestuarii TaxID=2161676 RepID=A0ABW5U1U8_9RHOB